MDNQILLSVKNVSKSFPLKGKQRKNVVQDVSFDIYKGETLALVGESGCGKSTLANLIMGILEADSGEIYFDRARISGLPEKARRPYRKRMQMVFQDPASSLDPRMTIRNIIAEPLKAWHICESRKELDEKISELLEMVEMREDCLDRYPHQFSGGQKQRIGIARAIATNPDFLICDESVSALDVSVQAQILNLLKKLKEQENLTCLFISHDLSVVNFIADRVCVINGGIICETAPTDRLFAEPQNEYTKYLLSSVYPL